jgi:biotin/methionine sulfoxide reductase
MPAPRSSTLVPTATHWGTYRAEVEDGRVIAVHPLDDDPDPSSMGPSMAAAIDDDCRIPQPMVRAGYLDDRSAGGGGRGAEPFVPVTWEAAVDLAADALTRVKEEHGNQAIYAGSYGWGSAGKFHHCQSQLHRFLNHFGGFTGSLSTYSFAAADVIIPHVIGPWRRVMVDAWLWEDVETKTELVVSFGGIPLKNGQTNLGGVGHHRLAPALRRCREAGVDFIYVGPIRDDLADFLDAEWLAPRPNTDTALMLGLAHTLVAEGRHDTDFLDRYATGFERFRAYLMGEVDGQAKDADWAAGITELDAATIRSLARRMAEQRTLITVTWSLQRADHGEQPYWMAVTLAAMLGRVGEPGCGVCFGYGAVNGVGGQLPPFPWEGLAKGDNPVAVNIPLARIADMLLGPGQTIDYNGRRITYPDIKLVYWIGGNPFHHHQDLNRLLDAWRRPETVIVHEPWWTPLARHADIVFPAATAMERSDFACGPIDPWVIPMHQVVPPIGEARSDFDIFSALADRLGYREAFSEGRDEMDWLRHLYEVSRQRASAEGIELPNFDVFWDGDPIELAPIPPRQTLVQKFRADPEANPLPTPSGKIEIFSETIASFAYDDCPGHATWLEPYEWLGSKKAADHPLHLMSNQSSTRLHSQLDNGPVSRASKVQGREPVRIHPIDAAARGIADGDIVRLFNDRGTCLAGAMVSDAVRPGVVQLATGAWYDPVDPGRSGCLERHGNPNVLTRDAGCSRLSQGPSPQSTLVEIERYAGPVDDIRAFDPPPMDPR